MTRPAARMTSTEYVEACDALRARRGRYAVSPKSKRTWDGIVFASAQEMRRYVILKGREDRGEISRLELQPAFPVVINGGKFTTYTADFKYVLGDEIIIEDVKSSGTKKEEAYRLRKRAAELFYGIRVVEVLKC